MGVQLALLFPGEYALLPGVDTDPEDSPMPAITTYSANFYADLAAKAAATPRRRLNHNLHPAQDAAAHRIFNAIEPDSYVGLPFAP